jgi:hypothetical protein
MVRYRHCTQRITTHTRQRRRETNTEHIPKHSTHPQKSVNPGIPRSYEPRPWWPFWLVPMRRSWSFVGITIRERVVKWRVSRG